MDSQIELIKQHLEKGYSITPIEALEQYGCFRLGARIYDLKKDGFSIRTDIRQNGKKRFAEYSLKQG